MACENICSLKDVEIMSKILGNLQTYSVVVRAWGGVIVKVLC